MTANLSLNQTLLTFLLYVRQTWMTQMVLAISLWEGLPLIQKYFDVCMVFLFIWRKEFLLDLSLENSTDSYLCFQLALLHSVSYYFFLYLSLSSSSCTVFDAISSNSVNVLSVHPSVCLWRLGDLSIYHKDYLRLAYLLWWNW